MTRMNYTTGWGSSGDDLSTWSVTLSFPPQHAVAQTFLSSVGSWDDAAVDCGIRRYRTRPQPDGPDHVVTFDQDYIGTYPPSISDEQLTSVTAWLSVSGGGNWGRMVLNAWFLA